MVFKGEKKFEVTAKSEREGTGEYAGRTFRNVFLSDGMSVVQISVNDPELFSSIILDETKKTFAEVSINVTSKGYYLESLKLLK